MRIKYEPMLTFDDVLLQPRYSNITSRFNGEIDLSSEILPGIFLELPVISANMSTVTEDEMANAMDMFGGLGIIHRFLTFERHAELLNNVKGLKCANLGVTKNEWERFLYLNKHVDLDMICLDIAHGDSLQMVEMIKKVKKFRTDMLIIAGNVATGSGAYNLFLAGADCVKCGIGSSGICSTRLKTGSGVPQFQAILQVREAVEAYHRMFPDSHKTMIADGGCKNSGDMCVVGDTRILTSDLQWIAAKNLKIGEKIIGFDEFPINIKNNGKKSKRRYRTTVLTANSKQILSCMKIITDKGEVTVSEEHSWLVKTPRGNYFIWKKTKDLKLTDKIVYFGKPWDTLTSYESNYIEGFMDGEGWLARTGHSCILGVNQVIGETSRKIEKIFNILGIKHGKVIKKLSEKNSNHQDQISLNIYKSYNMMKFLGEIRPQRLLNKAPIIWENTDVTNMEFAKILDINLMGLQETYSVTTEHHTFIAEGFLSHNCKALAAGANAVMSGGLFSGTTEAPGELKSDNQGITLYKSYNGMASYSEQSKWKNKPTSIEGISTKVPYKGSVVDILQDIKNNLLSAMSYQGVRNLQELYNNAKFIKITSAAWRESTTYAEK